MSSILRRPNGTMVVTVHITLRPGEDDDLIELVENAEYYRLARTVKKAMKNGVGATKEKEESKYEDDMDLSELLGGEL